MLDRFTAMMTQNRLCEKSHKVLLAVSGGVDSMVMLHLFHNAGYKVGVAHVNFQLREAASDEDERFVKSICDQLQVPFHTRRFHTNNYAAASGLSIQMAARELRYTWFREVMEQDHYDRLATAHHLNDNLETTLLHFVRGTGVSGLRGIPPVNEKFIRPLLNFTKEELVAYATANQLIWREDASNEKADYDRNFLRHEVIPKLKTLNPSLEESFKRTNHRLQGAEAVFQLGLEALKAKYCTVQRDELKISKKMLSEIPFPEVVLWELVKSHGFNHSQCTDVVHAANQSGKLFFSTTHQLLVDREWLMVTPILDNAKGKSTIINNNDKLAQLLSLEMYIERTADGTLSTNAMEAKLDASALTFPLTWRKWEEGDHFIPLGMEHKKKLSDFFIDAKVSRTAKAAATVLEANGEIIWVVGYRINNHYKLTEQTKEIIHLHVQPYFD